MHGIVIKTHWEGYARHDFDLQGRKATVVLPKGKANGSFVYRIEFFGEFAYADMEMLKEGWTLAYYGLSNMFGSPEAVEFMHIFIGEIMSRYSLKNFPVLFGFSRGGLYAFNYAAKYPEHVSCIYFDAPVLDIRSWPGGFFGRDCDRDEWQNCLKAYGYKNTQEAWVYSFEDSIQTLIDAKIPVIIVYGDSDRAAIYSENGAVLEKHYKKHDGKIKIIMKKDAGHHPHSLEDPRQIARFITGNYKKR